MKLKEYIEKLQNILESSGNLELIYASDEEGNSFKKVHHEPSVNYFDTENSDIVHSRDVEIAKAEGVKLKQVVCIN